MPELELEGVWREYGGAVPTVALRDVKLQIGQGEFVAIEGPSGGGKSTLLNIIGLLDAPTDGRYLIDGTAAATATTKQLAQLRSNTFAFIFQSFHLLDRRPVLHSVGLGLLYRGLPRGERDRRSREALRATGLEDLADQLPAKLSGGQRQRVAIARALAAGAAVVVADEPTGNLDSENSAAVVASLARLNAAGATVVLVTHSPEVAASAGRRLYLRDGELHDSAPDDVRRLGEPRAKSAEQPDDPPGRPAILRVRDLIADAAASVASRGVRSAGLVAAVSVGVALAVATLGISVSANAQVADTFDEHINRDVTVSWVPDSSALIASPSGDHEDISRRLAELNGVNSAGTLSSFGQHDVRLGEQRKSFLVNAFAMTKDLPGAARLSVTWAAGRDGSLSPGEVLVGASFATQAELGPLDSAPQLLVDSRVVTAVGIVAESPRVPELMSAVISPDSDAALLGYEGQVRAMILTETGGAQVIASQAPWVIDPFAPTSLQVSAPADPTTVRAHIESAVQATLFALTGVAFLASIAGLANAMMLSVVERRSELGLRRALGARPVHIASLILVESAVVGCIGGVVGLALGLGSTLAVTVLRHWSPVFDLSLAPAAIACGILVGAFGGLVASVHASRIQPSEALRM